MELPQPGHFWKTPFIWEPGCPEPPSASALGFVDVTDEWLSSALAEVMSHSLNESDQHAVARVGAAQAVEELLAVAPQYFERPAKWWRAATDERGRRVGFILPVLFQDKARWKDGHPQGTIFYMGVLPEYRGRGYSVALLQEATRLFIQAKCWRIFCDTGTNNAPMVSAFRRVGYVERTAWQRPLV
jgi:ribosomal protein S18 acetylase RimI-like enzyme